MGHVVPHQVRWMVSVSVVFGVAAALSAQDLGGWAEPAGGWDYVYEAFDGEDINGEFDPVFGGGSLDGTWTHGNGSDDWDGSGPGDPFRPDGVTPASPGGAGTEVVAGAGEGGADAEVLSVVDTGDPRSRGFPDPSNRKMWFCHDTAQDGAAAGGALASGLTLIVRSRLYPDISPELPGHQIPDGGIDNDAGQGVAPGYTLRDGGKGGHGFYDSQLDRNFSFTPHGLTGYQLPPQVGEGLPPANFLNVGDNTVLHAFWVVVAAGTQPDRFTVRVWVDGASSETAPTATFTNVQVGDDTDCDGISHLHMGFHSTPQVGGMQVDYFGYKVGMFLPSSPCPGGFSADFDADTGGVELSWSPVPDSVDSYTVIRDGAVLAAGIPDTQGSLADPAPTRPRATYELVPIAGGLPRPGCAIPAVAVRTVVCPVLSCTVDPPARSVHLTWTPPAYFAASGYTIKRDGAAVGSVAGDAREFTDAPVPPGEYTYELEVASGAEEACAVNAFCEARVFEPGGIEVARDGWDRVVTGGVAAIATTVDGAKSLYFPAVPKTTADSAAFAAEVRDLGAGDVVAAGRYRVELRARFDNEVRIVNRSVEPDSYVQLNLSRTGISTATDEQGNSESVEQVPSPGDDPSIDSGSSAIVNTDTVGIALVEGLNLFEIQAVDGGGVPHDGNVQIIELRIGPFADGLDASLVEFPCAAGLACSRDCDGAVTLRWTSGRPHAYEIDREGETIGRIPMGPASSFTDTTAGIGFNTYTLRVTDDPICPELSCVGGGGVPDDLGAIREWLVLGPLDWGCVTGPAQACNAPGTLAIEEDYLAGTSGGMPVDQATIEPAEGDDLVLGPQATVRAAPRSDINPGRPAAGRWFRYQSTESLIDYNAVFGGSPGVDFLVYAVTYVNNTTGDDIVVDVGLTSDDSVEVYVNETSIWTNNVARGVGLPGSPAWDVVGGVTLEAGFNRILVKVLQGNGGTGFALRFEQGGLPIVDGIEVSCSPRRAPVFVRGDPDANGRLELTDAIVVLNFLFIGASTPRCFDAADGDNNGRLELTDAVRILNYLFLGAVPPPPPSPSTADYRPSDCGADSVEELPDIGCLTPAAKCVR